MSESTNLVGTRPDDSDAQCNFVVPPSPSPSSVSSTTAKKNKRNHKHGFNWRATPAYNLNQDGGRVIEENDSVVFKVPEASTKKRKPENRFGEQLEQRIPFTSLKPLNLLSGRSLMRHRSKSMKKLLEVESQGKDLSDVVVDLHLAHQVGIGDKDYRNALKTGVRIASIPTLPPFQAFSKTAPLRSSLIKKDSERSFPLIMDREYIRVPRYKKELPGAVIDGLEQLKTVHADPIFHVQSVFTRPDQKLALSISALDVHIFNTHAEEMIRLSGVNGPVSACFPTLSGLFNVASFMRIARGDSMNNNSSSADRIFMPADENDADRTIKNTIVTCFAKEMLLADLHRHGGPVYKYTDKQCQALVKKVLELNERLRSVMTIRGLATLYPDIQCVNPNVLDKKVLIQTLEKYLMELLTGYVKWRYFFFPDLVAACMMFNYVIMKPALTKDTFVRCPAKIKRTYRSKRVCKSARIYDPSELMLFENFAADGFDVYGASLLLYKLICNKHSYLNSFMEREEEEDDDEDDGDDDDSSDMEVANSNKAKKQKKKKRANVICLRNQITLDLIKTDLKLEDHAQVFRQLEEVLIRNLCELYRWRRYPDLCSKRFRPPEIAQLPAPPPELIVPEEEIQEKAKEDGGNNNNNAGNLDYERKLFKSILLGRVIPLMTREKTPPKKLPNLEFALKFFEENTAVIGEKEFVTSGKRLYRSYPSGSVLSKLINMYLTLKRLWPDLNVPIQDREMRSFILANRSQCRGIERYTHANRAILFRIKVDSDFGRWYKDGVDALEKHKEARNKNKRILTLQEAAEALSARSTPVIHQSPSHSSLDQGEDDNSSSSSLSFSESSSESDNNGAGDDE